MTPMMLFNVLGSWTALGRFFESCCRGPGILPKGLGVHVGFFRVPLDHCYAGIVDWRPEQVTQSASLLQPCPWTRAFVSRKGTEARIPSQIIGDGPSVFKTRTLRCAHLLIGV